MVRLLIKQAEIEEDNKIVELFVIVDTNNKMTKRKENGI